MTWYKGTDDLDLGNMYLEANVRWISRWYKILTGENMGHYNISKVIFTMTDNDFIITKVDSQENKKDFNIAYDKARPFIIDLITSVWE